VHFGDDPNEQVKWRTSWTNFGSFGI